PGVHFGTRRRVGPSPQNGTSRVGRPYMSSITKGSFVINMLVPPEIKSWTMWSMAYSRRRNRIIKPPDCSQARINYKTTDRLAVTRKQGGYFYLRVGESSPVSNFSSESDYKSEKNLTLFINTAGAAKFKKAGIMDPAEHFKGKKVRATGTV